jgi:hypothetical protein
MSAAENHRPAQPAITSSTASASTWRLSSSASGLMHNGGAIFTHSPPSPTGANISTPLWKAGHVDGQRALGVRLLAARPHQLQARHQPLAHRPRRCGRGYLSRMRPQAGHQHLLHGGPRSPPGLHPARPRRLARAAATQSGEAEWVLVMEPGG